MAWSLQLGATATTKTRHILKDAALILGLRNLGQAALVARYPSHRVRTASAAVDAVHALSMVAMARYRADVARPCLVSATSAALLCGLSLSQRRYRDRPVADVT
jgi:hypothetical protein